MLIGVLSCSSVEKDAKENEVNSVNIVKLKKVAEEKYHDNFKIIFNSNKDFALCVHKNKSKIPGPESINYFVYDISKDKITYEGNIPNGSISWESDYKIRLEEIPGIIQKDKPSSSVYILNVKTNSKTKLDSEVK
ncbi:hypothetical protein MNBD_IGNAVI01-2120 [hydrothermal vent metagenome]|uniref:Uncharacterized protein n=1 Tax=hydrothermal vent metagenome TaxID=652676 RepID=A0A3B1DAN7_9ZZZZ